MRLIPISEELRDYVERLCYEERRYKDLLQSVSRDCCPMTEEEWNSSWRYFNELYEEAALSKKIALEEIENIYKDFLIGQKWYIDFGKSRIVLGENEPIKKNETNEETWSDYLTRLFPSETIEEMHMNGPHVKDITLQVTDGCNMACTYCY